MALFEEIALLVNGDVENVDTAGNVFKFETIRFGLSADLTEARAQRLINLQGGADVDASHHTHNSIYNTKNELGSKTSASGALLIGIDTTYAYAALTPVTGTLDEILKQIDTRFAANTGEFSESAFRVTKSTDPTAKIRFDVSSIQTNTVRSIKVPDTDIDLGDITSKTYVDNKVALAISGLQPKPAVQAATVAKDWLASPSNDFIGIKVDGTNAHLSFFRIYNVAGETRGFYFSTSGAVAAPAGAVGTLGTHRIDILTSDSQDQVVEKAAIAMQANLSADYTVLPFPAGLAIVGDIQLRNKANGYVNPIEVSDPSRFTVNPPATYAKSVSRGTSGVVLNFASDILTVSNMTSGGTTPIIDGIALDTGTRILVKDQLSGGEHFNGIWEVTQIINSTSVQMKRPTDVDGISGWPEGNVNSEVVQGINTFVTGGAENAKMGFVMVSPGSVSVNITAQVWTPFRSERSLTPNTSIDHPFINIDDYDRISVGPLLKGQIIGGSSRNDVIPVSTTSALSDVLLEADEFGNGGLKIKGNRITDAMVMTGTKLKQAQTFFTASDITGAEAETLSNGSNADALHIHNTTNITEGTKLFFTETRVRSTPLTGLDSTNNTGNILATDSIIIAFGKMQHAITSNLEPNKANISLNNLSNVAINTTLQPGSGVTTVDLGTTTRKFRSMYLSTNAFVDGYVSAPSQLLTGLANDTGMTNGSIWALNDTAKTLKYKRGDNVSDDIVLRTLTQTLTGKTIDFTNGVNTAVISTNQVTEGANLYYTQARFDAALAAKTTTNLTEGTNLYFTTARARTAAVVNDTTGSQTDQAPSVASIKTYVDNKAVAFNTVSKTLSAADITNQYFDLPHLALSGSVLLWPEGGINYVSGKDYTISTFNSVTRITLSNANMTALQAGDALAIMYAYKP